MPNVDYTAVIDVPRATVWEFVKDINNWAPLAKGYQSHEIVSDTESLWTVKGDIGPISRVTKFEVTITEWLDGDKVGFTLKGLNESITGEGAINLADTNGGSGTEIRGDALLEFGGSIGPIINHLFVPWAKEGADELVTKIALALRAHVRGAEAAVFPRRLGREALARHRRADGLVARRGGAVGGLDMRVETLLLVPSVAGGASGPAGFMDIDGIARSARRIEEMGFDGATAPEAGHDPFMPLAIAAEHTKRITLGTNVAIAFPRSPFAVAQIAWDLQRWSNGRFKLGSRHAGEGPQRAPLLDGVAGPAGPPAARVRAGAEGDLQDVPVGREAGVPGRALHVHTDLAVLQSGADRAPGRADLHLGAEHVHGAAWRRAVRRHPAAPAGHARLHARRRACRRSRRARRRPVARRATSMSSRRRSSSPGRTRPTVEAALQPVRQQISFYSSTRTYHSVLEYHGWTEIGQQLHALSIEGKWQEMMGLITDDMLDEFAIIGTYDEVAPKIKERWGDVATTMFLAIGPQIWQDEKELGDLVEALRKA